MSRRATMTADAVKSALEREAADDFVSLIEVTFPDTDTLRYCNQAVEHMLDADGFAVEDEHGVPVLPGAHEALGALGARGVRQCVCTSTSRDSAERTLAAAGLLPKIDALVCGDDIERSKPDPQIFLRGAQKLGVPIERCAVVEDAPAGIAAGLASGARVFCVPGLLEIPAEDLARCTRIGSLWELAPQV